MIYLIIERNKIVSIKREYDRLSYFVCPRYVNFDMYK